MNAAQQFGDLTEDEIGAALEYIDYDDRETWVRMAMCVKHELGPNGFAIWDRWGQKSSAYNATDSRDVWKSAKESGARGTVTIGTLIAEAQQFGFKLDDRERQPISQAEIDRRERDRREREAAAKAEHERRRARAASMAAAIWEAGEDIDGDEHPYLARKGVRSFGLRVGEYRGIPNTLLLPLRLIDGTLVSMQGIFERSSPMMEGRDRDYLPGGQKWGAMHLVGSKPSGQLPTILIGSGYATCASAHMATGHPAFVAFDDGNMKNVAVAVRNQYPLANIVILADDDCWHDDPKKPNSGRVNGGQAMHQCAGMMALPRFSNAASKPTDFNDLHMLDGLDAVAAQIEAALPKTAPNDNAPQLPLDGSMNINSFPHTMNGKVQDTMENLAELLAQYGIKVRYNVISKDMEIVVPGSSFSRDNHKGVALATINSLCARNCMPRGSVDPYLLAIADQNEYNPAAEWIDSKRWDGVDRLGPLTASMDPTNPTLACTLLRRWMIGAVGCVYNAEGMSMQGVLVLQGAQNAGKTTWFWQLVNRSKKLGKEGVSLDPTDRDSLKGAISHWLVELGEIDATFKKADIETLKQFITRDTDEVFLRYSRAISTFPRRTAYVGTVNPLHYLHDDTGNRRYWTIRCGDKFNALHGIDMQQAWAQAKTIWQTGEQHNLTREEMNALNDVNDGHSQINPIEELVMTKFMWDKPLVTGMTATDVLVAIGYDKPNAKQSKEAGTILRKLTGNEPKKSNGRSLFMMPPRARAGSGDDDLRPF